MNKRMMRTRLACQLSAIAALSLGATHGYAAQAFSADSKWMSGDWGGVRTELLEKGYDFSLDYVGEVGSNFKGGYNHDTTARYSDQFALGMHLDLQKILGWHDAEFKLTITERSGRNISNDRIADPRVGTLSSSQEVWGRGQTWRLTQLWYKQKYFDGALDIKLGRFGPGEDFNSFPCEFQNLAFCGSQVGNWAGSIWYNWPVSQWATRVKYNITPEFYAQVGAYNQNPSNLEIGNGFKLNGSGTKGTIFPVELVWSPKVNDLPGEYRVGYYYSTAKADDVYDPSRTHDSKHGWWGVVQQQLTSHNGDKSRGLNIFANVTVHDKATNFVDNFQQLGVVYKGPFDMRPKDDMGFAIARIHVNDDARKRAHLLNAFSGITDYDNPGYVPIQNTEYNAELNYGFHVTNWLTVRPNLQYVMHPGGVDKVDNALIGGVKIQSAF